MTCEGITTFGVFVKAGVGVSDAGMAVKVAVLKPTSVGVKVNVGVGWMGIGVYVSVGIEVGAT